MHWQDRILLSSVFFLPRLDSKELEEGKPWRTRTVSEEPQRWNSSESRGTTTVVGSKEMRAGERAAGTTPQSSVPSRAPAEYPRHTSCSQVCGTGCGTRPSAPAPGPAVPERCQLGCEGLPGLRGALPAASPARCLTCQPCPLPLLPAALPARFLSCPLLYLPAAAPARCLPARCLSCPCRSPCPRRSRRLLAWPCPERRPGRVGAERSEAAAASTGGCKGAGAPSRSTGGCCAWCPKSCHSSD